MSKDGTKLLFEGYLQKRKDTMVSYNLALLFNVLTLMYIMSGESDFLLFCFLPIENKMGDLLVQASKYNLVLLYKEEWQRCKLTFAVL